MGYSAWVFPPPAAGLVRLRSAGQFCKDAGGLATIPPVRFENAPPSLAIVAAWVSVVYQRPYQPLLCLGQRYSQIKLRRFLLSMVSDLGR